jgi:hypothetical protein
MMCNVKVSIYSEIREKHKKRVEFFNVKPGGA